METFFMEYISQTHILENGALDRSWKWAEMWCKALTDWTGFSLIRHLWGTRQWVLWRIWMKQGLKSTVESLYMNQREGKINQGEESWLKIQSSQRSKQTTPGRNPEEVDHSQQHASGYSPKPWVFPPLLPLSCSPFKLLWPQLPQPQNGGYSCPA